MRTTGSFFHLPESPPSSHPTTTLQHDTHTGLQVCMLALRPPISHTHTGTRTQVGTHIHTPQQTGSDVVLQTKIAALRVFAVTAKRLEQQRQISSLRLVTKRW